MWTRSHQDQYTITILKKIGIGGWASGEKRWSMLDLERTDFRRLKNDESHKTHSYTKGLLVLHTLTHTPIGPNFNVEHVLLESSIECCVERLRRILPACPGKANTKLVMYPAQMQSEHTAIAILFTRLCRSD